VDFVVQQVVQQVVFVPVQQIEVMEFGLKGLPSDFDVMTIISA